MKHNHVRCFNSCCSGQQCSAFWCAFAQFLARAESRSQSALSGHVGHYYQRR
ncbi:uncharacterized protein BJX67DRAFT_352390 [Aspergillus lucknowensis]|uniref:Uncharacterized protein n=1 Tax=Aspergillus lucknowensis TaxID=176173 RepID=A0ABR4LTH9_9EURO